MNIKLLRSTVVILSLLCLSCILGLNSNQEFNIRRSRNISSIFQDLALEKAICSAIGKTNIAIADLEGIEELNLANIGLTDLRGIEHLVNLKKLNISNNNISDISPLESLVKRGLDELIVTGNPLTMADLENLDIWSGSSNDRDLHRKLLSWGFRLLTLEGDSSLYTNDIYQLREHNGYIVSVEIDNNIVLNDRANSLAIDNISLEGDNLILLNKEREVAIITPEGLTTREDLAEDITLEPNFFGSEQDITIIQNRTEEEIEYINQKIREFVLERMNAYVITAISEPIIYRSSSGTRRIIRFDVTTDAGDISIYFKPVKDEPEGMRTERASEVGVAPASAYIETENQGYSLVEHFEGIQLMDLLWSEPEMLLDNYSWVFKELGHKIGTLAREGILYTDSIHFNTYVNIEKHEVAIIDYEIAAAGNPAVQIRQLIKYLDKHIDITVEVKQEMLNIFNTAYNEVVDTEEERL